MSSIPPPVQTLLDLFRAELPEVRFGEVDARSLACAAAEVHDAAVVVASARAALGGANAALFDRQESLLQQAHRALAYARVYAEADASLSARLEALVMPRGVRRSRSESAVEGALVLTAEGDAARRPRGRPRKPQPASGASVELVAFEPLIANAGE